MRFFSAFLLLGSLLGAAAQDVNLVLEKADKLFEEARVLYEKAKAEGSAAKFVEAAFKLEDARAKYAAVQEIGVGDPQKQAVEKLRNLNQLSKLINDGKKAVSGAPAEATPVKPVEAPAANPAEPARPAEITPVLPPPVKAARALVPEPALQREAEKLMRELFKVDYAKKAPADRRNLARSLLEQAGKSVPGSTDRWVLFREAQEMATQGADAELVAQIVDIASRDFEIDAVILKTAAMAAVNRIAKSPAEFALLADQYLLLAEESLAVDEFGPAETAASAAVAAARRTNDGPVTNRALQFSKEFAELKARGEGLKKAREQLLKEPSDAAANLEFGQFLCFVKGDWAAGLAFLAKGADGPLKAAAEKDLASPTDATGRIAVGDLWWDLADREKNPARKAKYQARMAGWYEGALPEASGLMKARIEKRLEGYDPGAGSLAAVNLMKLVDGKLDAVWGEFACDGRTLNCTKKTGGARVQVPYIPPAEYDVMAVVERKEGIDSLYIGLLCGASQCVVIVDGWGGNVAGLNMLDGRFADANESTVRVKLLAPDRPVLLSISVRKDLVTFAADGKKIFAWKGAFNRLSNFQDYRVPNPRSMLIGSWDTRFLINKFTLQPVSGAGKRLR